MSFGGLAWLFLVSATSALAFARLYLVRGRGGTSGGAPAGPTPGADLSLPLIPSRYCRAPPFCCGFCVLVLRHGAAPPLQPCPVCPLLVPLCAWLRCPACYSSARARQLASLSVAADGAAPVRPSARGRSARLQSLSPSSYGKLDAPASPTATTHSTSGRDTGPLQGFLRPAGPVWPQPKGLQASLARGNMGLCFRIVASLLSFSAALALVPRPLASGLSLPSLLLWLAHGARPWGLACL